MSKKKRSEFKSAGGPMPSPAHRVIDPMKRVKISKEAINTANGLQGQLFALTNTIGSLRLQFVTEETKLVEKRKVLLQEMENFENNIKKKYAIIGDIAGIDPTTDELILK